MSDYGDYQCHKCGMEKGEHTRECYYEMYIESGKIDFADMFEESN